MRKTVVLFSVLLALCLLASVPAAAQQCPTIVWADEFAGTAVDTTKWSFQLGDGCAESICGWGNNELQYYQAANATVSGGTLKITAKKERVRGKQYTSARLRTLNKGDFVYGRFEARIKMPTGKGIWPAFWMLATDEVYGGWPQSGEIDIMENIGSEPSRVHGTIHYGQPAPNNSSSGASYDLLGGAQFSDGFHDFAIEKQAGVLRWYVDGVLYLTRTPADVAPENWPFDERFHFLLNLAVGGNWPGSPDATTQFPQVFEVDHVRVYDGNFPYITGDRLVSNRAAGEVYSIGNVSGSTSVTWTVPAGASIVSGQGTPSITVNWGDSGGDVVAQVAWSCGARQLEIGVEVEPPSSFDFSFENFDDPPYATQGFATGTLTVVANPSPAGINPSATAGAYSRNANEQYDVLLYDTAAIPDASAYVTKQRKFFLDVYTAAPVGTTVLLQLEDSGSATPTNYPTGRHSRYQALTSVRNAWDRLEFFFLDRPDPAAGNAAVDNLILLFAPNSFTADTYTWDNLDSYVVGSAPPPPPPPPPPSCQPVGASCSSAADCCSNNCSKGSPATRVCQ